MEPTDVLNIGVEAAGVFVVVDDFDAVAVVVDDDGAVEEVGVGLGLE